MPLIGICSFSSSSEAQGRSKEWALNTFVISRHQAKDDSKKSNKASFHRQMCDN